MRVLLKQFSGLAQRHALQQQVSFCLPVLAPVHAGCIRSLSQTDRPLVLQTPLVLPLLFQPHVPLPRLALFSNPRNEEFAADLVECAITPSLAEDETGCAGQRFENLAGFGLR